MATFKVTNEKDDEQHMFIIKNSDANTENTDARHWVINHLDLSKNWTVHRVKIVIENKKLFEVRFTYDEHEMESDIYVGELGTTTEAREYLMHIHTDKDDSGYMQDAIENPEMLTVESVTELKTLLDKEGNPYSVGLL